MSLYLGENLISGQTITVDKSERIGQIIPSTIPLTDAGLHLLDGALIDGSGSYADFIDYISDLYGDGTSVPDYFTDETNWQSSVSTYGVCGKFVYDSENNTVRLPKITGVIEGTTDTSALGDLVEAGLPNITGEIGAVIGNGGNSYYLGFLNGSGAFNGLTSKALGHDGYLTNANTYTVNVPNFNASRSSSIYGNSSTVQPQTIKVLYYIVIATTTKTDIEVDIDKIATDLNGKADTDLTNITNSAKALISTNAAPASTYISLTAGASGSTYTAPTDGWFSGQYTTTAANGWAQLANATNSLKTHCYWVASGGIIMNILPVKKGDDVVLYYGNVTVSYLRFIPTVGRESEVA